MVGAPKQASILGGKPNVQATWQRDARRPHRHRPCACGCDLVTEGGIHDTCSFHSLRRDGVGDCKPGECRRGYPSPAARRKIQRREVRPLVQLGESSALSPYLGRGQTAPLVYPQHARVIRTAADEEFHFPTCLTAVTTHGAIHGILGDSRENRDRGEPGSRCAALMEPVFAATGPARCLGAVMPAQGRG